MYRVLSVFSVILCVSLSTLAPAGEPPSSYDRLKPLEWLIGDWAGEFTLPYDLSPFKKGDQVEYQVSFRWMMDRRFMVMDGAMVKDGRRAPDSHEILGWDPGAMRIVHWFCGIYGTGTGQWSDLGKTPKLHWSMGEKGKEFRGTTYMESKDPNTHTWQVKGITEGASKLPDWPQVTFRRKASEPAGDLWNAYREAAVGNWVGEGELLRDDPQLGIAKGEKFKGLFSLRPELDGKALVGQSEFELVNNPAKRVTNCVLAGWDADRRQVRFLAVGSAGLFEEIILTQREGTAFLGTQSARAPGNPTERGRIRMEYTTPDSYVITFLDGPHKGKVLSSWKRQPTSLTLLKEYGASMVGEWQCPGGQRPVRCKCYWALDGAALEWDFQMGNEKAHGLTCWDPTAQQLKGLVVPSGGGFIEVAIAKEGGKWVTHAVVTKGNGHRERLRAVTTFDANGDRHVNEYPTHKDVFTRVK